MQTYLISSITQQVLELIVEVVVAANYLTTELRIVLVQIIIDPTINHTRTYLCKYWIVPLSRSTSCKKNYVFQVSNYNLFRLKSYKTSLDELKLKLLMSGHVTIVNNSDSIRPPSNSLDIALKSMWTLVYYPESATFVTSSMFQS